MPPAARIADMHVCPMVTPGTPPIPHVGGPISAGFPTVMIGNMPAARLSDQTMHGGMVTVGFPTVMIGEFGKGSVVTTAGGAFLEAAHHGLPLVCKGPCAACGHL